MSGNEPDRVVNDTLLTIVLLIFDIDTAFASIIDIDIDTELIKY